MRYYRENPDEPIVFDMFEGCMRATLEPTRDFESLLDPALDEHFCSAPLTDSDIDELQQQKDI